MVDTHGAGRGEEAPGFCRREGTECGRRGCRSQTWGMNAGEGGRQVQQHHTGVFGLFPKSKEAAWSAARGHSGCAWSGLEGPGCREALGWCPIWEGAAGGEVDGSAPCSANIRWDSLGDCRWERARSGAREDPLVDWVLAPSLRWGVWHLVWERLKAGKKS